MNVEVHAIGPLLRRTINSIESLYGLSSSRWSADWDGESLRIDSRLNVTGGGGPSGLR